MNLNETYIDKIITETTNNYLTEKVNFHWKDRVKNGLKGFDVGGGYQKTVGRYASNSYSDIIDELTKAKRIVANYSDYLHTYNGNNEIINDLKIFILDYLVDLGEILNIYIEGNAQVNEGIGNRLGGFIRGFANNKDYSQEISLGTQIDINRISDIYKRLYGDQKWIASLIEKLTKQYEHNKNFIDKLNKINNGISYITNYINKISFQHAEKHSKWTDRGYKFGQQASKAPGKIKNALYNSIDKINKYGDKYDDTDNYEYFDIDDHPVADERPIEFLNDGRARRKRRKEPTVFTKLGQRLKNYAHKKLGDENYNALRNFASEED